MDKKTKKRLHVLKDKLQNRRQQLASAKKQPNQPHTIQRLTEQISTAASRLAWGQQVTCENAHRQTRLSSFLFFSVFCFARGPRSATRTAPPAN